MASPSAGKAGARPVPPDTGPTRSTDALAEQARPGPLYATVAGLRGGRTGCWRRTWWRCFGCRRGGGSRSWSGCAESDGDVGVTRPPQHRRGRMSPQGVLRGRRHRRTRRVTASGRACPFTTDGKKAKARRSPTPCHSQHIAHRGPCGKTRVVLQNLRPKPVPGEIGASRSACALVDMWVSRDANRRWDSRCGRGHSARRCGCARRRATRSSWPKCTFVDWGGIHD